MPQIPVNNFFTHNTLDLNEQIFIFGAHELWFGMDKNLYKGNFELTKVWKWGYLNARRRLEII